MERQQAIKIVKRLLSGKRGTFADPEKFGYQVDDKAAGPEEREQAKEALHDAIEAKKKAQDAVEARRQALLSDPDYRALVDDYGERRKAVDRLHSVIHRRKITVGYSNSLFFHVEAQGDSWEEIIATLKKEKTS